MACRSLSFGFGTTLVTSSCEHLRETALTRTTKMALARKFMMNGALTLETRDGATIEIAAGGRRYRVQRPPHRGRRQPDLGCETMPRPVEAQAAPRISPLAGRQAPPEMLVDVARLEREYYERQPDLGDTSQLVVFGTSGHRGSSLRGSFNESHVLAITQAICDYRRSQDTSGPLFMGKDTHALSGPAQRTALEVLAANGVDIVIQRNDDVTPTPVISRAILVHNRDRAAALADGIVITPSHNPPEDGGFKYNPTSGGGADTAVTRWVQDRANELLRGKNVGVKRISFADAMRSSHTHEEDFVLPYVRDLENVIDM